MSLVLKGGLVACKGGVGGEDMVNTLVCIDVTHEVKLRETI